MTADVTKVAPEQMINTSDLAELTATIISLPNTASVAELLVNCRLRGCVVKEDGPASYLAKSAPAEAPDGNWRIGIDTGGTFTDICGFDVGTGDLRVWKTPSTPHDPSQAIGRGLQRSLDEFGGDAGAIAFLGHGTTVATNALIQDRIAPTGLITTAGFRDLLEIARQQRPSLYDLQCDKPFRSFRAAIGSRCRNGSPRWPHRNTTRRRCVREAAKGFRVPA